MQSLTLKPYLITLLQEDGTAQVVAGNRKENRLTLRFKEGIEWTVMDLDPKFVATLPNNSFLIPTKWKFNDKGEFVEVVPVEPTVAKVGRGTGSFGKRAVA